VEAVLEKIRQEICSMVSNGKHRIPVRDLENAVARRFGVDKGTTRRAVKELVAEGGLVYTNLFGTSFLELSLERPVHISPRIVIKPPGMTYAPRLAEVVIDMAKGASFGDGGHATTRLVLQALDIALCRDFSESPRAACAGLDVGTGSGVLAIAMAKLGVREVLGIDVDPCAISEARHNVRINGLVDRVTISDASLEGLTEHYGVISANLAMPTLRRMAPRLASLTVPGGVVILSGFRDGAVAAIRETFADCKLTQVRQATEREWACTTWYKPQALIQ
jgi:ribosomal protein L11 methyltransferase